MAAATRAKHWTRLSPARHLSRMYNCCLVVMVSGSYYPTSKAVPAVKDIGKMLAALHYYDINAVFVDRFSLEARNLTLEQLAIPAVALDNQTMRKLLRDADQVLAL